MHRSDNFSFDWSHYHRNIAKVSQPRICPKSIETRWFQNRAWIKFITDSFLLAFLLGWTNNDLLEFCCQNKLAEIDCEWKKSVWSYLKHFLFGWNLRSLVPLLNHWFLPCTFVNWVERKQREPTFLYFLYECGLQPGLTRNYVTTYPTCLLWKRLPS